MNRSEKPQLLYWFIVAQRNLHLKYFLTRTSSKIYIYKWRKESINKLLLSVTFLSCIHHLLLKVPRYFSKVYIDHQYWDDGEFIKGHIGELQFYISVETNLYTVIKMEIITGILMAKMRKNEIHFNIKFSNKFSHCNIEYRNVFFF